ncbi:AbrB/MazE/SpoVT family DNA-binding domain-containing protein [Sphingomonas qilianensis]|uniref:AbrB/MazE/SpoVT family DNA-binding domain-containing protein n=1 Tax=Sphingomonas qilianensis TaxID=1736690 RepID=A0ABU9XQU7_9SPHN
MDDDAYHGTTFKSGNSVALRLPKGMGIPEGTEVRMIKEAPMSFRVEAIAAPRRTIDISGFAGKAPGAKLVPHGDFDERPSTIAKRQAASDA